MNKSVVRATITGICLVGTFVGAAAFAAPNQGDVTKVFTVDNRVVSCLTPVAAPTVEGSMGTTIEVSTTDPIDKVTIKSGRGAVVVGDVDFTTNPVVIHVSKDVSNYVMWTCPLPPDTGGV